MRILEHIFTTELRFLTNHCCFINGITHILIVSLQVKNKDLNGCTVFVLSDFPSSEIIPVTSFVGQFNAPFISVKNAEGIKISLVCILLRLRNQIGIIGKSSGYTRACRPLTLQY